MRFLFIILFFASICQGQPVNKINLGTGGAAPTGSVNKLVLNATHGGASGVVIIDTLTQIKTSNNVAFYFSLFSDGYTSAAVFNVSDGSLVRQLWVHRFYLAGSHSDVWDGLDDVKRLVGNGTYKLQVLLHNLTYTWEGGIGNTSDSITGTSVFHGDNWFYGFYLHDTTCYYVQDYNEAASAQGKFYTTHIGRKIQLLPNPSAHINYTSQQTRYVAGDGNLVYEAGFDPYGPTKSQVFALRQNVDTEITNFQYGSVYQALRGRKYSSVIDTVTANGTTGYPTGLAVEQINGYLFVSHGALNQLHVLDKATGQLKQTITTYHNPRSLAITTNDTLWMLYGSPDTVRKFTVDNLTGLITPTAIFITGGFSAALSIAVSPDNTTVIVADAGTSQQVKAYWTSLGTSRWTFGSAGGYRTDATVSNTKFYFTDSTGGAPAPLFTGWVAYAPDGSFWVGDGGNYRAQHYDASRTFVERIQYLPRNYNVVVDPNNINRVFATYLEFLIDYTKPLDNGVNGSWTLVRNWGQQIPSQYSATSTTSQGFTNLATLSNGHTYGFIKHLGATANWDVWELQSNGALRNTGVSLPRSSASQLYSDGSVRMISAFVQGVPTVWSRQNLTGFSSFNPQWGTTVQTAATPPALYSDAGYRGAITVRQSPGEVTSVGTILAFDQTNPTFVTEPIHHLGAYSPTLNKWMWQQALTTNKAYSGVFPTDGKYDIGNNGNPGAFTASYPKAIEHSIFWHFFGEGWKGGETVFFDHLYENGQMLWQYGMQDPAPGTSEACAGCDGNGFSWQIVKDTASSNYYIWQNDESWHGFVHRIKISGVSSITPIEGLLTINPNTSGLLGTYFDSANLNVFNVKTTRVDPTVDFSWGSGAPAGTSVGSGSNMSVSWKGWLQPAYSEAYTFFFQSSHGARLWMDRNMLVDRWDNNATQEFTSSSKIATLGALVSGGFGYSNGTLKNVLLTAPHGMGATADLTVAGNIVKSLVLDAPGSGYVPGDTLTAYLLNGSGLKVLVGTVATTVPLTAGVRYPIRVETNGGGSPKLSWSSPSQAKQVIPQGSLYPAPLPISSAQQDLMADLFDYPLGVPFQNNLYGWMRSPAAEDLTSSTLQSWQVRLGRYSYQYFANQDLHIVFQQPNTTAYTLSRDLGTNNVSTSWELSGTLFYPFSPSSSQFNDGTKYGQYLEVLDTAMHVLARFYINQPSLGTTASVMGNTKVIATGVTATIRAVAQTSQGLDIKAQNGQITIIYGSYSAVSDGVIDPAGNWRMPKTVRVYSFSAKSGTTNLPRSLTLQTLNFSTK